MSCARRCWSDRSTGRDCTIKRAASSAAALTLGLALAAPTSALIPRSRFPPPSRSTCSSSRGGGRRSAGAGAIASRAFGVKRVLSVSFVSASNLLERRPRQGGRHAIGIFVRIRHGHVVLSAKIASLLMSRSTVLAIPRAVKPARQRWCARRVDGDRVATLTCAAARIVGVGGTVVSVIRSCRRPWRLARCSQ